MINYVSAYFLLFLSTAPLLIFLFLKVKRKQWKGLGSIIKVYQILILTGFILLLLPIKIPVLSIPSIQTEEPQVTAVSSEALSMEAVAAESPVKSPGTNPVEVFLDSASRQRGYSMGNHWLLLLILLPAILLFLFQRIRKELYLSVSRRKSVTLETRRVTILYSPSVSVPFASGPFRKEVFIPRSMMGTPAGRIALIHELQHLRQADPVWNEVDSILSALFWFNPLHRWVQNCHGFSKEVDCDQEVLRKVPFRQYLTCLSESVESFSLSRYGTLAGLRKGDSGLLERIRTMKDKSPSGKTAGKKAVSLLSLTLLAGLWFSQSACTIASYGSEAYDRMIAARKLEDSQFFSDAEKLVQPFNPETQDILLPFTPGTPYSISSSYGQVPHPDYPGQTYLHRGISLKAKRGTGVYPIAPGVVYQSVSNFRFSEREDRALLRDPALYGNYVVIYHGNAPVPENKNSQEPEIYGRWFSYYSHLEGVQVEEGQFVGTEDALGKVGRSGRTADAALELEIQYGWRDGVQNPNAYIDFSQAEEKHKQDAGYIPLIRDPGFTSPFAPGTEYIIFSLLGNGLHPIHKQLSFHKGMDLAAVRGSKIFPVGSGTVMKINHDTRDNYGKYIIMDHGNGFYSLYAHMDEIFVDEGQRVKPEEEIGTVGRTGLATGPHLHLEIWFGDTRNHLDPAAYIDFRDAGRWE